MPFSKNDNFVKIVELQETRKPSPNGEKAYPEPTWESGWRTRFPWIGLGSLFLVLISAMLAAIVLLISDQRSQSSWPQKLTPSIILAGISSFSDMMLLAAIGQGVAIVWWRKSLRGATVNDLHRSWSFSTSFIEIIKGPRYFNVIALASLAAKLTIVDSILLQGATSMVQGNDKPQNVQLSVPAMTDFPITGLVVGQGKNVLSTTHDFQRNVVMPWLVSESQTSIPNPFLSSSGTIPWLAGYFPGCDGFCESTLQGLGFEYSCTISRLEANYDKLKNITTNLPVFRSSFDMSWATNSKSYASIVFNGLYYQSTSASGSCAGHRITYRCDMRPAIMDIDFTTYSHPSISGSSNSVSLGFPESDASYYSTAWNLYGTQINGWRLNTYLDITETGSAGATKLGGIQLALNEYLGSTANITYNDATEQWDLSQDGWYAASQLGADSTTFGSSGQSLTPGTCNYNYADATIPIISSVNTLSFILNTFDLASSTTSASAATTPLTAAQTHFGIHYHTNYAYLAAAIASMLLCVACVLPAYHGFWELGRDVTLGPFEIANAFRSPVLERGANGTMREFLREVGGKTLMYGEMTGGGMVGRLAMDEVGNVRKVKGV